MKKDTRNKNSIESFPLLYPGMEGSREIMVPDDREESFLCYEILSNNFLEREEKSTAIENLNLLIEKYPKIGDLQALLVIGYRGLEMDFEAQNILKKALDKFQKNLTIKLLSYLYDVPKTKISLETSPKTLTQSFVKSLIKIKKSFDKRDVALALEINKEMIHLGNNYCQMGHWALGEALAKVFLETQLDPLEII